MKVSLSLRGRPKSEEHRARISAALKGKAKSEAHRERIGRARRERPKMTPERLAAEARAITLARRQKIDAARFTQWHEDLAVAYQLDQELFDDVLASMGWSNKRKKHHPQVSDGYDRKTESVKWHHRAQTENL